MELPLAGQVALVAGATRGAGRGVAIELAAAGAKVYCTGRSTRTHAATPGRAETIDETAEMIVADGGQAVAVQVDHTQEDQVAALAGRLAADEGRLDVLVNDIWGGDELIDWAAPFWKQDIATARAVVDQAVFSHWITARHLAPMMVAAGRGLIVEVTDGDQPGYRGQLTYDFVKAAAIRLAYAMAWDLAPTGVTALAISPGFLRSEAMLDRYGVSEATWREAAAKELDFSFSESPRYLGRAVAALAADPKVRRRSGQVLWVADLARDYGFTDVNGETPDFWGNMEAWLEGELAGEGELDQKARHIAGARYGHIHPAPARAEQARRYAERLGYRGLGAGLRPFAG
jgi:NAD(P)-dependent dehydrogenase (short-subunit alcohol dehydrogenase family)